MRRAVSVMQQIISADFFDKRRHAMNVTREETKLPLTCSHCKRDVETLYEIGGNVGEDFAIVGKGCYDCVTILIERLNQTHREISSARFN